MEPLFRILVVGIVPQPVQIPPPPFEREDLQRAFFDVTRTYPYSQFGFLPADQGAQIIEPPEDRVMIQPGLLQIHTPIDQTPQLAREKALKVLATIADRVRVRSFLHCGIKVVANVPAPPEGARAFVSDRLLGTSDRAADLGANFFGGGVKFRSIEDQSSMPQEEVLLIEPLVMDDSYIWIDYDIQRVTSFEGLDVLHGWVDEAFTFVREPAMAVLKEA